MRAADAQAALERFVAGRGSDLDDLDAEAAVDAMLTWYELERPDDVDVEDNADMLLFQWGAYDWGGRSFHYNITRQLIFGEEEDIWQLSMTLHYPPNEAMVALAATSEWCRRPDRAAAVGRSVRWADHCSDRTPDHSYTITTSMRSSSARKSWPLRV